jgi:hypothetical protein
MSDAQMEIGKDQIAKLTMLMSKQHQSESAASYISGLLGMGWR